MLTEKGSIRGQHSDRSLDDGCGSFGDGKVPHGENLTQSIFCYMGISAGFFILSYLKNVVLKDIAKCCMYSSLVSAKCSYLFSSDPSKHQNKV